MMLLGSELQSHGRKLSESITGKIFKGLYSTYRFDKGVDNSVLENNYISLLKYRNYELKKITE